MVYRAGERWRAACVALSLWQIVAASTGCKRWSNHMEAGRQEMISAATPCASPAACTGKLTVSGHELPTCSALPSSYAPGDVVVLNELGNTPTLARVKSHEGGHYQVTWAEGVTNDRAASAIIAKVCK